MDDSNSTIKIAILKFGARIRNHEAPLLRGAILSILPKELEMFHNHMQDGEFNYTYPLIQYKCIDGHACMVFLNDAVEEVGRFINPSTDSLDIGNRKEPFLPMLMNIDTFEIGFSGSLIIYSLKKWIPLNKDNYIQYLSLDSLTEKVNLLNHILVGNILSCLKGLGFYLKDEIHVSIQDLTPCELKIKGTKFMAFDATFVCNVNLPEYIGLGKSTSKGLGVITKKNILK